MYRFVQSILLQLVCIWEYFLTTVVEQLTAKLRVGGSIPAQNKYVYVGH